MKTSLLTTIFTWFFLTLSLLKSQTVVNEYTNQKNILFQTSFEFLEGDGDFRDSTIYNSGDNIGELANNQEWGRSTNTDDPGPYDGDYYWKTNSGDYVRNGYSYILSTPWYTGRKLQLDYFLAADIYHDTNNQWYRVFQDKKSTPHALLAQTEHQYDGILSNQEGVTTNHWNQSYNSYSKTTTFDNNSVTDSTRFIWHLRSNWDNHEYSGLFLDSVTISSFQRVIEHDNLSNTTNPGGPYRVHAVRNDTITWLHDLKIFYSIDNGETYTEALMNSTSSTQFYFDIPGQPFGTNIQYYLQCLNNQGITHISKSSSSLDYSFSVVDNGSGYSFNKIQPVNFSEDVDIYTVMAWTDLGDPNAVYTVQYGTDIDFQPGTFTEKNVTVNELYNPVDFIKDEVYYWRVFAVNTLSGDTVWSDGGQKWTFEIVPPEIPSVLTAAIGIPANRTIIPENNPYRVVGTVRNNPEDTLTVSPGVEVWWDNGTLDIRGLIKIEGTPNNRITFKSDPDNNWTGGIALHHTSPMLKITNDFEYQNGPKITYSDFYNGGFNDNGWTGAYISHTNAYDYGLYASFGVIDSCIIGGGGGSGLNEIVDTLYTPMLVKDSEFTGDLIAQRMDSLVIKNCLFEYAGIHADQSFPAYVNNITVNNGFSYFSGHNDSGLRFGSERKYLKITDSDFLESTNWAIRSFDALSVDFEDLMVYQGFGGIFVEGGPFAVIKNVNVNEVERQGIFVGYHGNLNDRTLDFTGPSETDSLVIDSCTVSQSGSDGIVSYVKSQANHVTITNNTSTTNRCLGLFFEGGGNSLIRNNSINGNGIGGRFHGTTNLTLRNNEFVGNAPGGGFYMKNSNLVKIAENIIRYNRNDYEEHEGMLLANGNFRAGMSFMNIGSIMIDSNIVTDNEYHVYRFNNIGGNFGTRGLSWKAGHQNGDDDFNAFNKQFSPITISNGLGDILVRGNTIANNITYCSNNDGLSRGNGRYRFSEGGDFWFIGGGISAAGHSDLVISNNLIESNEFDIHSRLAQYEGDYWRNKIVKFVPAAITYFNNSDTVSITDNMIIGNSFTYKQENNSSKSYRMYAAGISPVNKDTNPFTLIENNTIQGNTLNDNGSSDLEAELFAVGLSYDLGDLGTIKQTSIHANTIVDNNLIVSQTQGHEKAYSAGVYINGPDDSLSFKDNIIVGNIATNQFDVVKSGGLFTNVSVVTSTISQNQGKEVGGIYYNGSSGIIKGCTITLNTATNEDGVGAIKFPPVLTNSIVVDNRVLHEGEIIEAATGGIWSGSYTTEFHHNNIYGNSGYDFRNSTDLDIDGTYNWWNSRSEQILINDEIFDGVDNAGVNGLVTYQPFLTFSSDSTFGQIVTYDSLKLFTDNTFQESLGENIKRGRRFFAQLYVQDGNPNSVDQTAIKITNLRNGDFIAPVATETGLSSGQFRASAAAGFTTTFVYDSLRSIHGDTLELCPYNFQSMKQYIIVDTTEVSALMGDANEDGGVDILDVMQIVGYILSSENSLNFYAADVNYDSYINVLDIIGVINIIIDGQSARVTESGTVVLDAPRVINSSKRSIDVPIHFNNTTALSGFQLSINIGDKNMNFVDAYIEGLDNGAYHKIVNDSSIFIIAYSVNGLPLSENGLNLFLNLENNQKENSFITFENIIGSDLYGNQISIDINNRRMTVIPVPETFNISNAYPNPFNPKTTFDIEMPRSGILSSSIYDLKGTMIKKVFDNKNVNAGYHKISWDGKDTNGLNVANGVYFIKFQFEQHATIKRMLLLK